MKLKEHINYSEYNYTEEEFEDAYKIIKSNLTTGLEPAEQKRTIILGGQPGSGKSTFYEMREDFIDYVAINGDEFRRFHPRHKELESDIENYAKNTQKFSNAVVEKLIKELGDEGYSLIIEGTLRSYEVPVKTCEELKSKGYHASLQ
jgi:UDP-N-acetylglucosamine kinase